MNQFLTTFSIALILSGSTAVFAQDGSRAADAAGKMFISGYKTDREIREEVRKEKLEEAKRVEAAKKKAEFRKPLMDSLNAKLDQVNVTRVRIIIEGQDSKETSEIEMEIVKDENGTSVWKDRNASH